MWVELVLKLLFGGFLFWFVMIVDRGLEIIFCNISIIFGKL